MVEIDWSVITYLCGIPVLLTLYSIQGRRDKCKTGWEYIALIFFWPIPACVVILFGSIFVIAYTLSIISNILTGKKDTL